MAEKKLKRKSTVLVERLNEKEYMLFDKDSNQLHILNQIAYDIYLQANGNSVDDIVRFFITKYPQNDSNKILNDTLHFIDDLKVKGLVS